MKLRLVRKIFTEKSTIGKLYINDRFQCFTLEDTVRNGPKVYGETAIPYGTYTIILDISQRFGKILPRLLRVPNFEGVRIHCGNRPEDSEGCILVGLTMGDDFVGDSRKAFLPLLSAMQKAAAAKEKIEIEIVEG